MLRNDEPAPELVEPITRNSIAPECRSLEDEQRHLRHMVTIDVRRHAERAGGSGASGGLPAGGLAMARRLGSQGDRYALVVSSPRERARATAMAIAQRVDEVEPMLAEVPDDALTQAQYDTLRSQEDIADLIRSSSGTSRVAEEQVSLWRRVAQRLRDGESALLLTHGGNIELPAVVLATRGGAIVGPLPLGYCEGVRVRFDQGRAIAVERLSAE